MDGIPHNVWQWFLAFFHFTGWSEDRSRKAAHRLLRNITIHWQGCSQKLSHFAGILCVMHYFISRLECNRPAGHQAFSLNISPLCAGFDYSSWRLIDSRRQQVEGKWARIPNVQCSWDFIKLSAKKFSAWKIWLASASFWWACKRVGPLTKIHTVLVESCSEKIKIF